MKVFHAYGTPERLFEMMKRVNKLNEEVLPREKKNEVINEFVGFVNEKLGLGDDMPKIKISYDDKEAQNMKSFGKYTPETNELRVVAINRNLADVLRTLAHELIHNKQRKEGVLKPGSNETGSEHENEANSFSGVMTRQFGRRYSEFYE